MKRSFFIGLAVVTAIVLGAAAIGGLAWYRDSTGYWIGVLADPAKASRHGDAVTVLNERSDPQVIPALIAALEDPDPAVRLKAAQSLGWRTAPEAVGPLMAALKRETDASQRAELAKVLGQKGDASAAPALVAALGAAEDKYQINDIATAIGYLGAAGVPDLIALLDDPSPDIRKAAIDALDFSVMTIGREGEDPAVLAGAVEPVIAALGDPAPDIRTSATDTLGSLRDPRAVPPLVAMLGDPDPAEREVLARVLSYFGKDSFPLVVAAFQSGAPAERLGAAEALAEFAMQDTNAGTGSEEERAEIKDEATRAAGLLDAAAASNDLPGVGGYSYFIRRGRNDALGFLVAGLNAYGNPSLAERFLNAGNDALKEAATAWATANNFTVETQSTFNGNFQWGSGN